MGLLDDAIREHLELKRQHGASDEEIVQAETEALGPARREPGAAAEGAGAPPLEQVPGAPVAPQDLPAGDIEPPPPPPPPEGLEQPEAEYAPPEQEAVQPEGEYQPAEAEEGYDEPEPGYEEPGYAEGYSDETQIRPVIPHDPDADDDYLAPEPATGPEPAGGHPPFESTEPIAPEFDDEPDEVPADERLSFDDEPPADPHRARTTVLDDALDEMGTAPPPPPQTEPPGEEEPLADEPEAGAAPPAQQPPPEPGSEGEQDVLEETPDFLQETPEHDKLWFEQKPPRDFDFD